MSWGVGSGDGAPRGFLRLLAARLTSQVADGWFQAALAGNLLFSPERRAGSIAIAAGFAILLLPYSVLGPFVGVFLDRWYRRTSMWLANLLRAAVVIPTALLLWRDDQGFWFASLALVVIAANRFFLAGMGAALPHVVDGTRLVTANAIATTLGTASYATGLGTAALLLNALPMDGHGYAMIAMLGSGGYLISAVLLRGLFGRTALGPDDSDRRTDAILAALTTVVREMVGGLRHLAQRRAAGYAMVVQAGHRALFGALSLATLLLFTRYLTTDNARSITGLGAVVAAGGLGALIAAVVTPIVTRRMPGWAWISMLLAGGAMMLLLLGPTFRAPLLVLCVLLLNVASQGTKIVVDTTLQHECDDAYRGRVFSVNDTAFNLTFVAGLFTAAVVLPPNGRSEAVVVVIALAYAALAAWYAVLGRRWANRSASQVAVSAGAR
ncbi:MAG: MFS transporter [Micromonosporaceae bacterium]